MNIHTIKRALFFIVLGSFSFLASFSDEQLEPILQAVSTQVAVNLEGGSSMLDWQKGRISTSLAERKAMKVATELEQQASRLERLSGAIARGLREEAALWRQLGVIVKGHRTAQKTMPKLDSWSHDLSSRYAATQAQAWRLIEDLSVQKKDLRLTMIARMKQELIEVSSLLQESLLQRIDITPENYTTTKSLIAKQLKLLASNRDLKQGDRQSLTQELQLTLRWLETVKTFERQQQNQLRLEALGYRIGRTSLTFLKQLTKEYAL